MLKQHQTSQIIIVLLILMSLVFVRCSSNNNNKSLLGLLHSDTQSTFDLSAEPTFTVNSGSDSISLENINVPGAIRYKISWKHVDSAEWQSYDTFLDNGMVIEEAPLNYTITNLLPWDKYIVKVNALSLNNEMGATSQQECSTLPPETNPEGFFNLEMISLYPRIIVLNNSNLQDKGIKRYTISSLAKYTRIYILYYQAVATPWEFYNEDSNNYSINDNSSQSIEIFNDNAMINAHPMPLLFPTYNTKKFNITCQIIIYNRWDEPIVLAPLAQDL